jgi:hypothetical protein
MEEVVLVSVVLGLLAVSVCAGVSGVKSNGNISGVPSSQVTCTSGSSHIIYKKSGTWYHGSVGSMGNKYNSWSTDQVADYACNNL